MNDSTFQPLSSRREFIKTTGRLAAVSALAGVALPHVHAAGGETIRVALIGCGGRGTGAAHNALKTTGGPIELVAMADVFENRLNSSFDALKKACGDQVQVKPENRFVSFDGYQQAMDCLKPGDVAIFATPPAFRWIHFGYAIKKGLNVFMEKPVTVDGPTSKRMFALEEESRKKNLKVGVGLMCRHCRAREALHDRIKEGAIGDILLLRAYRMHGPVASFASGTRPADQNELLYQIQRFHSFLWASGGAYNDFYIHNIDECCWMKDAWPVKAQALGGRHYRGDNVDQNFDVYSVEYTFEDGAKLLLEGRCMNGCKADHSSHAHGSKGMAIISAAGHWPTRASLFKTQKRVKSDQLWAFGHEGPELDPYQVEWQDLVEAIRGDKPYNEVRRGVEASLVSSMGRMAAHTGQEVTFEEMLNCEHEFAPGLEQIGYSSAAPVLAAADGKYPVPMPGITKDREY